MNNEIKQIAERLRGLREVLDLTIADMAKTCGITEEEYSALEIGEKDIQVSLLHQISQQYNIDLSTLMFGDEPKMSAYFLTRKGKGAAVERTKAYKYQALAAGFAHRKADPFMVTVEPKESEENMTLNSHPGQEFNYVVDGTMLLRIAGKDLILEEGDSIMFDATRMHGMRALNGKKVKFLAIIL